MNREKLIGLVTRAQGGDSQALDALFNGFYNDVYYFALKTIKDSDIACDITQETFLEIIRTIGSLKEPAAFVTWMKQITFHRCSRYFNKKKDVLVEADEDGNTIFDTLADESEGSMPAEVLEKEEFRRTILDMIDQLTEEQRSAVLLYYYEEMTVGQIAQIQGVSEGTVKSRLNYARKAVRRSVEAYEKKNGIKLHSVAFLPLFMLFFGKEIMPQAKAAQIHSAITEATKAMGTASAAATTGVMAKLAQLPLMGKLVAGALAAALVIGVTVAVVKPGDDPAAENSQRVGTESGDSRNEHTDEQSGPVKYESQLLGIYNESDQFRDVFRDYAGDGCAYFWDTDGDICAVDDTVNTVGDSRKFYFSADADVQEYCMAGKLPAYIDSQGVLHLKRDGAVYPCPDLKGQVLYYEDDPEGYLMHVCSVDEEGYLYVNTYDQQGNKQGFDNTPLFIGDTNRVDSIVSTASFRSSFFAIIDGMVFENSGWDGLELNGEKPEIFLHHTGIPEKNLISRDVNHQYIYHEEGVFDSIVIRGYNVSLPEGKTVDQIALAMSGYESIVIFDDGSVYIHLEGDGDTLILSRELTELYKAGAIRRVFISAGIVLLMDDNVTYIVDPDALT